MRCENRCEFREANTYPIDIEFDQWILVKSETSICDIFNANSDLPNTEKEAQWNQAGSSEPMMPSGSFPSSILER